MEALKSLGYTFAALLVLAFLLVGGAAFTVIGFVFAVGMAGIFAIALTAFVIKDYLETKKTPSRKGNVRGDQQGSP